MLADGSYAFTVGELIEELSIYKPKQVVFILAPAEMGAAFHYPVYKTAEDLEETRVVFYLGDPV